MVIVQKRSTRKPTGGRFHVLFRSKRKYEIGRPASMTGIGERFLKVVRTKGGEYGVVEDIHLFLDHMIASYISLSVRSKAGKKK